MCARTLGFSAVAAPPNSPLQRIWSSLTLGTRPLNGRVVGQTKMKTVQSRVPAILIMLSVVPMGAGAASPLMSAAEIISTLKARLCLS